MAGRETSKPVALANVIARCDRVRTRGSPPGPASPPPGRDAPEVLPELLTPEIVLDALAKGAVKS